MLTANDLAETVAFYEKLGFECIGMMGEPKPFWCQVKRDDVWLMFNQGDPEPHDHGDGVLHADTPGDGGGLYINVDDADALFAEFAKVVDVFEYEPTNRSTRCASSASATPTATSSTSDRPSTHDRQVSILLLTATGTRRGP